MKTGQQAMQKTGSRNPEQTQQRILEAALEEFSGKGFAGARVDVIARRARINKRMLYHYFGDKEGLFREVLRRKIAQRARTWLGKRTHGGADGAVASPGFNWRAVTGSGCSCCNGRRCNGAKKRSLLTSDGWKTWAKPWSVFDNSRPKVCSIPTWTPANCFCR